MVLLQWWIWLLAHVTQSSKQKKKGPHFLISTGNFLPCHDNNRETFPQPLCIIHLLNPRDFLDSASILRLFPSFHRLGVCRQYLNRDSRTLHPSQPSSKAQPNNDSSSRSRKRRQVQQKGNQAIRWWDLWEQKTEKQGSTPFHHANQCIPISTKVDIKG